MIATAAGIHQAAQGSPWRARKTLGALAMIVGAVALSFASTTPASAYSMSSAGYPGAASTPFIYGSSTGFFTGAVLFPSRTVTESARYSGYDQFVCVTATLVYSWGTGVSNSWTIWGSAKTSCAFIPAAASSVTVSGTNFTGLTAGFGYIYAGNVSVTWLLANGSYVGTRIYDYNTTNDYRCQTAKCHIWMTGWGGGAGITLD